MVIHKNSLMQVLILGFLLICVFFPGDPYKIKIIFFILVLIGGLGILYSAIHRAKYSYIFIMGILFPICSMIFSTVMGENISASFFGVYPATLILVVPIINEKRIAYENLLMFFLKWMAIFTIVIVLLDILGVINVNGNNFLRNAFYTYDMGLMGKSYVYAAYYKIFFKTSPLLLIFIPFCFENNRQILAIIAYIALVLSGTRANIFVASIVFVFGFVNLWSENKENKLLRLLTGILICCLIMLSIPTIVNIIHKLMNTVGSINSDSVRLGQLASFMDLFSNPQKLLFGEGFGTKFFDIGRMEYTTSSEIAYLDLIRKIGLILFVPFMIFVLKPFKFKIPIHDKLAYAGYLVVCFTNPLIFSSTAYVLYILLYSKYYKRKYSVSLR